MKAKSMQRWWRAMIMTAAAAMALALSGCLEQFLVWSPDGQRAVVIDANGEGLRLSDGNGKLSAPAIPGAIRVTWLPDSRQIVAVIVREEGSWNVLAKELTADESARVIAHAEAAWQEVVAGKPLSAALVGLNEETKSVVLACLRERRGDAVRGRLRDEELKSFNSDKAVISEIAIVRVEGDSLVKGAILDRGLKSWLSLDGSPDGKFFSAVRENALFGLTDSYDLFVASVQGGELVKIADAVAIWPDWTPDGRSLVYFGGPKSANGATVLGGLVRQEVLSPDGKIVSDGKGTPLGGWIFRHDARVRCLSDGRIVFNAAEITFPITPRDFGDQHEQLFALDLSRQATLVRLIPRNGEWALPRSLAFFEVSPDEKQVLFGSYEGDVALLNIADGEVQQIQKSGKYEVHVAPRWRSATEFSYLRAKESADLTSKGEVVLRDGDKERVLSAGWPAALIAGWGKAKQ
jgi:hypothetical protein